MKPTLEFNNAEFARVLAIVAKDSETRTFPESCNAKGLHLASAAIRYTEKANIQQIAHELGQVATTVIGKKGGRLKHTKRVFSEDPRSLAYRIVVKRFLDSGKSFTDEDVVAAVKRMRAARLRSVAFIKSGWIYAVRILAKVAGYAGAKAAKYSKSDVARMSGLPKGFVKPATRTFNGVVECVIGNSALLQDNRNPMPVAQRGLDKAFQEVIADMKNHLEERMFRNLAKYGVTRIG